MPRIYTLLALDGDDRSLASRVIHCADHDDALALASLMTRGHAHVQVWAEGKLVGEAVAGGEMYWSSEPEELVLTRRPPR